MEETGSRLQKGKITFLFLVTLLCPHPRIRMSEKNRFIFVSPSLVPESFPLRDLAAAIDDGVPALLAAETVLWKKMYEHPTRAFNFPEGILAIGGLSPLYPIHPKAFHENKEMSLWNLLQADCKGILFVVEGVVNTKIEGILGGGTADVGGAARATEETPYVKEGSPEGSSDSQNSSPVENMSSGDEDLEPRSIRLRLRSANGQKSHPTSRATFEVPPANTKGSLSKHLKTLRPSSNLVSGPFLGSSKAPIVIPTAPVSSQAKGKFPKVSVAPADPTVEASPVQATGQSRFRLPDCFRARSPLAPLFSEGVPAAYVPRWRITPSTVVDTPEVARDLMAHALPLSHRCKVVDAEKKLLERENVGARLEQRERAWEQERGAWLAEKELLLADVKHYKEVASVSATDVEILYADLGIAQDDSKKLAAERHCLLSQGFGLFLSAFSQSEEFKGSLERINRAYRDVGSQAGLKDGYSYSSQGLKRKETPHYNSRAKTHLAKLDEEFGGKTPALIAKITDNPLMSLDELKSLLESAGPSSLKPRLEIILYSRFKTMTSIWL
ncbi:hypothetical protein Hdeb2414_s0003g00113831 [Helianthus debilis subsp. tardiflorus]